MFVRLHDDRHFACINPRLFTDDETPDIRLLNLPPSVALQVFFFFQAEDGIRDRNVTGVQTCALPISYQANVMKTFEAMSSRVAEMTGFTDQVLKQSTPRSPRAVSVLR